VSLVTINMIVNYTKDGWQIITQRCHGLMAAEICSQWEPIFEDRWLETIIAVAEHDDAYNEFTDVDVLNEQGGPLNFNMRPFVKDFCDSLLNMALSKSTYIAILISYHIQFLYGEKSEAAMKYCNALKSLQRRWRSELKIPEQEIKERYRLLQWCDALSLIICQKQIPPEGRRLEISVGPQNTLHEFFEEEEGALAIDPWPFVKDRFSIRMEWRNLESLVFKDVETFHELLRKAPLNVSTIHFKKC